jgi:nicotinamide-nucleotide amidase
MIVETLSSGTELLRGRGVDTNASWVAGQLARAGLEVVHHQTVDDDFGRLVDAFKLAASRSDLVILTGGLGPTEDDHTRTAVEEAFHRPLVFRPALWKAIQARFRRTRTRMAAINRRQAFVPKGAVVLANPNGTAPGFLLHEGGVTFVALPGPPREMRPMLLDQVLPRLDVRRDYDTWEGASYGLPEGSVDEILVRRVGGRATYGVTARAGRISFLVRAQGPRRKAVLASIARRVKAALGGHFMDGELNEVVVRTLLAQRATLAVAESCTGGLIAHKLTEVPGASGTLLESVVTYSNASKASRLGVPIELIRRHGAVSPEVAREMSLGIARTSGADHGLAVTGIAGPSGGSDSKPVGLCHIALDGEVETKVFSGDRAWIKERAAGHALNMLRLRLLRKAGGNAGKALGLRAGR